MIELIENPLEGGTYGLENIPPLKFRIDQTNAVVNLTVNQLLVFSGSYAADDDGMVDVDFKDILSGVPSSTFIGNVASASQGNFTKTVMLTIFAGSSSGSISFYVVNIRCRINGSVSQLMGERFLTIQPTVKYITAESKEYLTFKNSSASSRLAVKFYSSSGGETVTVGTLITTGVMTCDVSPSKLLKLSNLAQSSRKPYFDVSLQTLSGGIYVDVFKQRYVIKSTTESEKYYIFENDLGGFDTMICKGILVTTPSVTYNTARLSSGVVQLDDTEDDFTFEQMSGYFPASYRNWIKCFIRSKRQKYIYDPDSLTFRRIVVTEASMEVNDRDGMMCFTFSYIYADGDVSELTAGVTQAAALVTSQIDDTMGDVSAN